MTEKEKELVARIHASNYRMLDELDRICRKHGIRYYLAYGGLLGAVREGDFIPWDDDLDVWMTVPEYRKLLAVREEIQPPLRLVQPEDYGPQTYDFVPRINDTSLMILGEDSPTRAFYRDDLRSYAALDIFLLGGMPGGVRGLAHKVRLAFWYGVADTWRNQVGRKPKKGLMAAAQRVLHLVGRFTDAPAVRRHCWRAVERYPADGRLPWAVLNNTLPMMGQIFRPEDFEPAGTITMRGHTYTVPGRSGNVLRACYGADYMQPPPEAERRPHSIYK